MYQFSRSLYRELAQDVVSGRGEDVVVTRMQFFNDVRHYFPMTDQMRVYRMCEKHMELATEYVDSQLREGVTFDGSPACCHASTRRGTACQRVPLPGSKYCPSHKHLDDDFEVAA
jgi:hypothetical protein